VGQHFNQNLISRYTLEANSSVDFSLCSIYKSKTHLKKWETVKITIKINHENTLIAVQNCDCDCDRFI
jgi:hypothetical protein